MFFPRVTAKPTQSGLNAALKKIKSRLEKHRAKRAKIEAQIPDANLEFDQQLAKQIAAGRLTEVQVNYLKRNCLWDYAAQLASGNSTVTTAELTALIKEAAETEDRRKRRRQRNKPKSADQLNASDLAGGYFSCPHMPNTVEEAMRIKERNIRRAAEAAALAAKRTAATDAGSFIDLLPSAVKRRRRARLGLPARSATASSAASNDIVPEFDNSPVVEEM